jgi:glycosyltransferase involved in cell wall biosynthesis
MPVRNAAPWLAESLESLRSQSERAWELIAVDDGSTDASRTILERCAARDARVRVLATTPRRRGIVRALNLALACARAPLVARMDADDIANRERLALQCAALDADRSLFAVACCVEGFPDRNLGAGMRRYLEWQNGLLTAEDLARERFIESPILHPSIVMRRRTLRAKLGGWRDRGWPEDWDLFLRAFEMGLTFERVARVLLRWRLHRGQATRVEPRYAEEQLVAARAHFLARTVRERRRPVWMLGAGPVGKALGKALARERVDVEAFVDVDPRKIGGRIRDGSRAWPVVSMNELFALAPRPLAVSAVARAGARVRKELDVRGWREGDDYFVAA